MNLVDCVVTEIISLPKDKYGKWWIDVKYESCGRESETDLMFDTEEEARTIRPGYKFLA